MGSGKVKILKDVISNFLLNKNYDLSYVIEPAEWSIKWDGEYITKNLNKSGLLKARVTTTYWGIKNQIIHFGSLNTFLTNKGFKKPHSTNKTVVTCFHLVPDDSRLKFINEIENHIDFFHTSANITKQKLIELGILEEKIVVIPLGVDLSLFKPLSLEERQKIKRQLQIPADKIVIGSFQKDGVGWGEGLEPKLIKGPEVFIQVIEKLAKEYPVFVLLVGPARGYIKNELKNRNIPFKHTYLRNFQDIVQYYHALDLYLITSKVEGGPKQILESWASGIPVVSTKVGMVPDIAQDEKNVLLAKIGNIEEIVNQAKRVIENTDLKKILVQDAISDVQKYRWENIVRKYHQEIYSRL
jgi:glycosyltransferase involved in cell wall biosynthesis